jgi:hypothetical protein
MTAAADTMPGFVATLWRRVPREIHPSARNGIRWQLIEAQATAEAGDMREAARLLKLAREKTVDELRWEATKREMFGPCRESYKLRCRAERWEAQHG